MLAMAYDDEHKQGFNPQPNSLDRALAMARRAVAAGPSNHIAHAALAQTLFFRRDLQGFRSAANRALALNPMDAYTTAFMGILIAYSGDWEYGSALAEKGDHPTIRAGTGSFFFREYGRHEYRALSTHCFENEHAELLLHPCGARCGIRTAWRNGKCADVSA
jgi:hypothetical protein